MVVGGYSLPGPDLSAGGLEDPIAVAPLAEPMRFAPEPVRPSTAAQAIQMSSAGLDPFSTGEGGAAAGLPADLFAFEEDIASAPAPAPAPAPAITNPFDDAPTSGGVPAAEVAPPRVSRETPFVQAPAEAPVQRSRKPARLKMHHRERESFLVEYRGNLRRNGTFIKTQKPLSVGRDCIFEVDAPGLTEPLVFNGVVTYVSDGSTGEPQGMGVEYRLTEAQRLQLSILVGV